VIQHKTDLFQVTLVYVCQDFILMGLILFANRATGVVKLVRQELKQTVNLVKLEIIV